MADRILILERDPTDPAVWAYGLADANGHLPAQPYQLRHSPTCSEPPTSGDWHEAGLWVTAVLLVRQAGAQTRIVYNLTEAQFGEASEPPPRPPAGRWERSTAKKLREAGETLAQRADRGRRGEPRAAA
jgi:hypothetical protein